MGRLVTESFRNQGHLYGVAIAAMVIVALTSAGTAWIMESIINTLTDPEKRSQIILVAGGVLLLFTLKAVATYIQSYMLSRAGNRIVAVQQDKVFRRMVYRGVDYFAANESSDLLIRVTQGAQAARALVDTLVTGFVRDALTLVGLVAVMFYQQPFMSMVIFVIGPVALIGIRALLKQVRSIMEQQMTSLAEIIKVIQETSTGIKVVKIFALENHMIKRMDGAIRSVEQRANDIARLQAIASPMMEFLAGAAVAIVLAISALDFLSTTPPTAGQLVSFLTAMMMAYEPAKRLSRMRVTIEAQMVMVRMMFELLDQQERMVEAENPVPMPKDRADIMLDGVSFKYSDEAPVIRDMTLAFDEGKTTALVGPSGGGKSTILGLIMRFYDPNDGAVRLAGEDVRDVSFADLRHKISYVGQDPFLFATTVMENLRIAAPDASDDDIFDAARAAHAHDFILALPEGYETQVGENGTFLSGGQRQRIAIARALLRKAEILLLDEATSALDANSEALVKEALDRLTDGITTIVIAHRLSTVLSADKIVVIEAGEVAQQGTLDQLLQDGGTFKDLFDKQFGGHSAINAQTDNPEEPDTPIAQAT
ncbi:MAG: ABC transporter ATP-binding protein/permease [Marinibacterium sp.]|nr:ABC transporter ATP-binding protein/permease [Marinibacterium sp.]